MVFLNQRWKDTADNTQKAESHPSEGGKKKKKYKQNCRGLSDTE